MKWLTSVLFFIAFVLPLIGLVSLKRKVPYLVMKRAIAIIPAHNEENVISRIVKDCKLNGFAEVWVIADACTDKTVQVVTDLNCRVVEVQAHSKNKALNEAVPLILKGEFQDVEVFFFDADNSIEKDFLLRALPYLEFYSIVQYRVRNLNYGSWTSRMYCILMGFNYRIQQAFYNLHLSNLICGTGWACNVKVLQDYPFTNFSNTDFEFAIKTPVKIKFIDGINVYDEKPDSFVVSLKQRTRWMRGLYQVLFGQYRTYAWQKLWVLYFPIIGLVMTFLFFRNVLMFPLSIVSNLSLSLFLNALYYGLILDQEDAKHIKLLDYFTFTFFAFTHYFIMVYAVLTFKNHFWYRTPHKGRV
jgi:cellulose synthase/poly-beta-1,6-N-acetylglucosamine synthase-like glycosyltransferase